MAEFLQHLDGVKKDFTEKVYFIASTNLPGGERSIFREEIVGDHNLFSKYRSLTFIFSDLDSAVIRRLPIRIFFGLPDKNDRKTLLKLRLGNSTVT